VTYAAIALGIIMASLLLAPLEPTSQSRDRVGHSLGQSGSSRSMLVAAWDGRADGLEARTAAESEWGPGGPRFT
jgi:hypothetical protein